MKKTTLFFIIFTAVVAALTVCGLGVREYILHEDSLANERAAQQALGGLTPDQFAEQTHQELLRAQRATEQEIQRSNARTAEIRRQTEELRARQRTLGATHFSH